MLIASKAATSATSLHSIQLVPSHRPHLRRWQSQLCADDQQHAVFASRRRNRNASLAMAFTPSILLLPARQCIPPSRCTLAVRAPIRVRAHHRISARMVDRQSAEELFNSGVDHAAIDLHGPGLDICPHDLYASQHAHEDEGLSGLNGGGSGGGGGGRGGRGSGGGGGGEGEGEEGDEEMAMRLGMDMQKDLPSDLKGLSGKPLSAYLNSTRGGLAGWLAGFWPGWRRRVAADPEFPFKLLMEQTVGVGLAASGMVAARGKAILCELDLALCDIAVGATLNFLLVFLLTPVYGATAGRVPTHVFATGPYSAPVRVLGFVGKGALFAGCGFAGSVVGTTASRGMMGLQRALRRRGGGDSGGSGERGGMPDVFANSVAWAGFMFVSANPRYQALAGMEGMLSRAVPASAARLGCGVLRTANSVLGGAQWVLWAKKLGLGKSVDPTSDSDVLGR